MTFKVDHRIVENWTDWMKHDFIPELSAHCGGGPFQLNALLNHDDPEGATFVLQLRVEQPEALERYLKDHEGYFHNKVRDRWGDGALFFQTILKRIE